MSRHCCINLVLAFQSEAAAQAVVDLDEEDRVTTYAGFCSSHLTPLYVWRKS